VSDLIKQAILKIWPRKPEKPTIPTREEMRSWHWSQGPVKGYTYPTNQHGKN